MQNHPAHATQSRTVRQHSNTGSWRHTRHYRHTDLGDEVRAAANDLFHHVDELHYTHGWPYDYVEYEQRAYATIQNARARLDRDENMTVYAMLRVLIPVMNEWWPERSPLLAGVRSAVDRIRRAAAIASYHARP